MDKKTNGTATGTAKNPAPTGKEVSTENKPVTSPETSPENDLSERLGIDKDSGELKDQKPGESLPPIEARLKKLEELNELVEKRDIVVTHLENLNRFYISPNGQNCNLKLTDSRNNSFGIANPIVIGEIVHMSKAKLQDELNRIEAALVFNI